MVTYIQAYLNWFMRECYRLSTNGFVLKNGIKRIVNNHFSASRQEDLNF